MAVSHPPSRACIRASPRGLLDARRPTPLCTHRLLSDMLPHLMREAIGVAMREAIKARSRTCSRTSLKIRIAVCLLMAMLEGSASSWASSSRAPSSVWAPLWAPTAGSSRDDDLAMDLASISMAELVISPISECELEARAGGAHDGAPTRHRIRQPRLVCRRTLRRAMTPAIRTSVPNAALRMTGTAGPEGGDGGDGGGNEGGGDGGGRGGSGG